MNRPAPTGQAGQSDMTQAETETETEADFTHQAEMGFTHRELLQGLPSAVAPFAIEKRGDGVYRLHDGNRQVRLTLQPETSRAIYAIRIPVTAVKLEFFGFSETRFEDFMRRYKRYLHKGGG